MSLIQYVTTIIALIRAINELLSYLKSKNITPEEFFLDTEKTFKEMQNAKTDEEKFAAANSLKSLISRL